MHIEFCTKLNFLEGEYAITQNIGFLLSWVGNPCRYLVLRPCKIRRILWMPSLRSASALTAYWFFIWRKIYAPADLLCKYFNLAGAPKRTVGYLVMVLFVWQNQKSWYKCRFRFFQNRMVNPCRKFFEPGFPHNFAKNDRQDLKMGCTDASRRQLQSVLKIGV